MKLNKSVVAVLCVLLLVVGYFGYQEYRELKVYKEYVHQGSVSNLNSVIDETFALEAILENISTKGYILESDMAYLESSSNVYISNMVDLEMTLSEVYGFDAQRFVERGREQSYDFNHIGFYYDIVDIYGKDIYSLKPSGKYVLSESELTVVNDSLDYIRQTANIIREYYSEFDDTDYTITEESVPGSLFQTTVSNELKPGIDGSKHDFSVDFDLGDSSWTESVKKILILNIEQDT